jgi:methyl-accepting chemotaxis protein
MGKTEYKGNGPENTKDFIAEIEQQLRRLETELDELKVKANLAKADARDEFEKRRKELNEMISKLRTKLKAMTEDSDDAIDVIKKGVENAYDELKDAFDKAYKKFKKE